MLSLTDEYALQAAVYLATHRGAEPVPGRRIASELGIPPKYLSTILRNLVRVGVLQASPGKNGGFRMVRSPKDVRLYDVLSPFDSVVTGRNGCPFGNAVCSDSDPCCGHERWKRVKDEFDRFLMETSVHDVSVKAERRPGDRQRRGRRP